MFRGFFFAVLLQVRGLWKRASWKPAMCFTWKPIVEWSLNHWNLWYISILRSHQGTGFIKPWLLLGYLQLCYLSFGMKGCECCETGCGFTHSTWPLKYRKQESVTPPCSVPGRLHYPAKICVVFAGLPNCHGICSTKKLLLPSGLQIKLCLSHCKKTCPKPQKSLHADLLRSMTRASVLSGDFPTFGSSNPEMLSLQYPKFLVHGSKDAKDIQRLQDASGILQQYHRFISL